MRNCTNDEPNERGVWSTSGPEPLCEGKIHTYPYIVSYFPFFAAIECEELVLPANGEKIMYTKDTVANFEIGTLAIYTCLPGYTLLGDTNRTCIDDNQADGKGVWNITHAKSEPTCNGELAFC